MLYKIYGLSLKKLFNEHGLTSKDLKKVLQKEQVKISVETTKKWWNPFLKDCDPGKTPEKFPEHYYFFFFL